MGASIRGKVDRSLVLLMIFLQSDLTNFPHVSYCRLLSEKRKSNSFSLGKIITNLMKEQENVIQVVSRVCLHGGSTVVLVEIFTE